MKPVNEENKEESDRRPSAQLLHLRRDGDSAPRSRSASHSRPDVRVIALDGNGSLLMDLGSLCTIATEAPCNVALIV